MKNKGYAKFWGASKVHYGKCTNGELSNRNMCLLSTNDEKMVMVLEPRLTEDSITKP